MLADLLPWRRAALRWPSAVLVGIGRVAVVAIVTGLVQLALGVGGSPFTSGAAWAAAVAVVVAAGAASGWATWRAVHEPVRATAERWITSAEALVVVGGIVGATAPTLSLGAMVLVLVALPAALMALLAPMGMGRRDAERLRALRWRESGEREPAARPPE